MEKFSMNQYIVKVKKNGNITEHRFSSASKTIKGAKEDAKLWLMISGQKCIILGVKKA